MNNNQKRDRPVEQIRDNELELNILGVMSELAACEILSKNNRVYKRNKSESNKSVKEPDIIVDDNITVEVKGHPKHVTYWRMNKKDILRCYKKDKQISIG